MSKNLHIISVQNTYRRTPRYIGHLQSTKGVGFPQRKQFRWLTEYTTQHHGDLSLPVHVFKQAVHSLIVHQSLYDCLSVDFDTESSCVAQIGLEPMASSFLSLLSAECSGMHHSVRLSLSFECLHFKLTSVLLPLCSLLSFSTHLTLLWKCLKVFAFFSVKTLPMANSWHTQFGSKISFV